MKKYWAVLLVICMVIGTLSGCGNSESSKAPQTYAGSQSGQTAGSENGSKGSNEKPDANTDAAANTDSDTKQGGSGADANAKDAKDDGGSADAGGTASEYIANLLAWGVEGTDYQLVDGIAKYMEGKDKESYHSFDFAWGNQFLLHPWEGQPADFRKQQETDLNSVPLSKYLGFSVDMAPISNELSAASVAINEYIHSIDCGFGDDAMYEEFLAKLKANGCDKIIEEYQRQLDEWLAVQ